MYLNNNLFNLINFLSPYNLVRYEGFFSFYTTDISYNSIFISEGKATEVTYVKADDGHNYLVRNLPDKKEAAELTEMKKRLAK